MLAAGIVVLFGLGFGAGRVINLVRSGDFSLAGAHADAATATSARTRAAREADAGPAFGVTVGQLQSEPWRASADRIDEAAAVEIKAAARRGDAMAQALACLGHLAGADGFLPSPTAAREQCDAAAAQHQPAGLYFSWVLRRSAPHAGLDEATARNRLAEAARLGWAPAIIDYAQTLAPDWRAPIDDQAEAGRLWLASAERNDPRGQYFYARWLRDSPAGPRDPGAAIPYLERASQAGQVDALHMLATLYRDGVGAPRNEARAKALYDQAARQDHPPSMFNLADMLRRGSETERARAIALYRQLACMPDEHQIQPMAAARLRSLGQSASCP
jgi:TPR repeat protein